MGAKFCISNILPYMDEDKTTAYTAGDINVDDTDINTTTGTWSNTNSVATRSAYAFMPDAALLEVNPDLTTKIAERSDKSFNYYAYMKAEFGAVRMEEEKVVVIPCLES
jgi:hypothetical protein